MGTSGSSLVRVTMMSSQMEKVSRTAATAVLGSAELFNPPVYLSSALDPPSQSPTEKLLIGQLFL